MITTLIYSGISIVCLALLCFLAIPMCFGLICCTPYLLFVAPPSICLAVLISPIFMCICLNYITICISCIVFVMLLIGSILAIVIIICLFILVTLFCLYLFCSFFASVLSLLFPLIIIGCPVLLLDIVIICLLVSLGSGIIICALFSTIVLLICNACISCFIWPNIPFFIPEACCIITIVSFGSIFYIILICILISLVCFVTCSTVFFGISCFAIVVYSIFSGIGCVIFILISIALLILLLIFLSPAISIILSIYFLINTIIVICFGATWATLIACVFIIYALIFILGFIPVLIYSGIPASIILLCCGFSNLFLSFWCVGLCHSWPCFIISTISLVTYIIILVALCFIPVPGWCIWYFCGTILIGISMILFNAETAFMMGLCPCFTVGFSESCGVIFYLCCVLVVPLGIFTVVANCRNLSILTALLAPCYIIICIITCILIPTLPSVVCEVVLLYILLIFIIFLCLFTTTFICIVIFSSITCPILVITSPVSCPLLLIFSIYATILSVIACPILIFVFLPVSPIIVLLILISCCFVSVYFMLFLIGILVQITSFLMFPLCWLLCLAASMAHLNYFYTWPLIYCTLFVTIVWIILGLLCLPITLTAGWPIWFTILVILLEILVLAYAYTISCLGDLFRLPWVIPEFVLLLLGAILFNFISLIFNLAFPITYPVTFLVYLIIMVIICFIIICLLTNPGSLISLIVLCPIILIFTVIVTICSLIIMMISHALLILNMFVLGIIPSIIILPLAIIIFITVVCIGCLIFPLLITPVGPVYFTCLGNSFLLLVATSMSCLAFGVVGLFCYNSIPMTVIIACITLTPIMYYLIIILPISFIFGSCLYPIPIIILMISMLPCMGGFLAITIILVLILVLVGVLSSGAGLIGGVSTGAGTSSIETAANLAGLTPYF